MSDDLQKYFTGRDKRLESLTEEKRRTLAASATDAGIPQDTFVDRSLVSLWLQQRTNADPKFVRENLDTLVRTYFGANDTPSSAYDKLTQSYTDWSGRVERASATQKLIAERDKQRYEDRMIGGNALRSFGGGAATTTLSMAEGVARQADLIGQGPGGGIPIGMMGTGPVGYVSAESVRDFEKKGYQPGLFSEMADSIWRMKKDTSAWFDVDPAYANSFMGVVTSGAGSIVPQMAAGLTGPGALAALESQAFTSATDAYWQYKGISPDQATPEQRQEAAGVGIVFAAPSMVWNKFGLDKIMGSKVEGEVVKMTAKQFLKSLPKPTLIAGASEASSQALDDIWQDVIAKLSYAPEDQLFTSDDIKRYIVDSTAAFLVGGGASVTVSSVKAAKDKMAPAADTPAADTPAADTPAADTPAAGVPISATDTSEQETMDRVRQALNGESIAAEALPDDATAIYAPDNGGPLTEQEAALLVKHNTTDGVLDEQTIVEMCEDPADGAMLLEAVKGDKEALDAYNDLLAKREVDPAPEITEETLDDIVATAKAFQSEPEVDETDGSVKDVSEDAETADMKELEDIVAEELEAQGREEGESAEDMRKRARAIAWEMYSPKNDRLMAAQTARFLGYGKLSRRAERRMIRAAREQFLVAVEKVYGRMTVSKVREAGWTRLKERLTELRQQKDAKLSEVRADREAKLDALRAEKNAKISEVREAGWTRLKERLTELRQQKDAKLSEVRADRDAKLDALREEKNAKISEVREAGWLRLETKVFELRQRHARRLAEANGRRARKNAVKRLEGRVDRIGNAIRSAKSGNTPLRMENADAVEAYIKTITTPPSTEDVKAFNDLQARMQADPGYTLTPEDLTLTVLISRPRLGDAGLTEAQAMSLLADLNSLIRTGRDLFSAKKELQNQQEEAQRELAINQVTKRSLEVGADTEVSAFEERSLWAKLKTFVSFLLKVETLNVWLTGDDTGNNAMTANTLDVITAAAAAEYRVNLDAHRSFGELSKRTGVSLSDGPKTLVDAKGKPVMLGRHKVKTTEAMSIYAHSLSEQGRDTLYKTKFKVGKILVNMTDADVKAIVDALPQKYKDFVDGTVDYLSSTGYDRVNSWFKPKFGIDMPRIEKYFPLSGLNNTGAGVVDMLRAGANTTGIQRGFTKDRKGNIGFRSLDFNRTLLNHLTNVNHLVAMEGAVSRVNRFLNPANQDTRLRDAVEARLGPKIWSEYTGWLKSIELGRTDPGKIPVLDKLITVLRSKVYGAYLKYNPFTAAKVMGSLGPGLRNVEPAAALRAAGEYFTGRKTVMEFVAKNTESAEVLARFGRLDQVLRDMTEDPKLSLLLEKHTGVSRVDGWMFTRVVEANQTCYLWYAKYLESSKTKPHAAAVKDADRLIASTQQSGQLENLPSLFRGDPIYRSFTAFLNDSMNIMNEGVKVLVARGTKKQIAKRIAAYVVFDMVYPAMIMVGVGAAFKMTKDAIVDAVRAALGWEEKRRRRDNFENSFVRETARMALVQPIQCIPIIGDLANWGSAELFGDEAAAASATDNSMIWAAFSEKIGKRKYVSAAGLFFGVPGTSLWGDMFDGELKAAIDSWQAAAGEADSYEDDYNE